jgi:hypothetical protein
MLCEVCIGDYCLECNASAIVGKTCGISQCDRPAFTVHEGVPMCAICAGRVTLPLHCARCGRETGTRSLYGVLTADPCYCVITCAYDAGKPWLGSLSAFARPKEGWWLHEHSLEDQKDR